MTDCDRITLKRGVRRHARKRCRQRLGFNLSRKMENQITKAIRKKKHTFIRGCKDPNRILCDVDMGGRVMRVVYDKDLDQIVTVLHRNKKSDYR
jgi:hypothetical protein